MWELIRRLGLLFCMLAAIVTFFQASPLLLEIHKVDFQKDYLASDATTELTLDEYIAQKTLYKIQVLGTEWQTFFKRANEVIASQVPPGDWQKRLSVGWDPGKALYFNPNEPPLNGIYSQIRLINKKSALCYLSLSNGDQTQYLAVFSNEPSLTKDTAQAALLYPFRSFSLWLAIAGVAIYGLIPWRRRKPVSVAYPLLGTHVILMDIGASLLTGIFFAFPFIVINGAGVSSVFDSGWIWFTLFWWLLSLLGVSLYLAAAMNAAASIEIYPDRLTVAGLWQTKTSLYSEMTTYRPYAITLPSWTRGLVWLLAILFLITRQRGSMVAITRILRQESNGILITLLDGSDVRIWNNELPEFERITQMLDEKGIVLATT
ncbi:MAG: hypothetical protein WCG34_12175 [Leptolinea sp.]